MKTILNKTKHLLMKKLNLIIIGFLISNCASGQIVPLNVKCIGGTLSDNPRCFYMLGDEEFIVAGSSFSLDGDLDSNSGNADCWFVHLDTSLNILRSMTFGESGFEHISDMHILSDTSFLLLINGNSTTGDFSSNIGGYDTWIRSYYPDINWLSPATAFGGTAEDLSKHISPKTAGGYLVCGSSRSVDGDLQGNYGTSDFWVMSLSPTLSKAWSKNFGGSNLDEAIKVFQLSDGNILVFGNTSSSDGMVSNFKGIKDVWVVKLNSLGDTLWTRCYGGTGYDEIVNVVPITTDQFALVGNSNSSDGDFFYVKNKSQKLPFSYAFYHVIDGNGDFVTGANKLITDNNVFFTDVIYSCSQDINVFAYLDVNPHIDTTNNDIYIMNFNSGALMKTETYGGNKDDGYNFLRAHKFNQTDFLVVASTYSDDLSVTYHGENDVLLAVLRKAEPSGIHTNSPFNLNIFPNPTTHKLHIGNLPQSHKWFYMLSDISGKLIISGALNADCSIDVSGLNNGVYLLSVSDSKIALAKKLVVNK